MLNIVVFDKESPVGVILKSTAEQVGLHIHLVNSDEKGLVGDMFSAYEALDDAIDCMILVLGQGYSDSTRFSQEGLVRLESYAREHDIPVVIQSSAAVFSGEPGHVFTEQDVPKPESAFGRYCWSVEQLFSGLKSCLVVRTGWLYSERSSDWFMRLIQDIEDGKALDFPADQVGQPTSCHDLSRVLIAVIEQLSCSDDPELWSVYHYASADQVSKNRFCQTVINEMVIHADFSEVTLDSTPYQQRAIADDFPQNSVLDCTKILSVFGIKQRAWKREVSAIISKKFAETENR